VRLVIATLFMLQVE